MQTLKNYWFITFSLIWAVIFTLTKLQIYLPKLAQFYLLDLIAVPVLANLGLCFLRFIMQNNRLLLKIWQLLFIVISTSIFFEVLMPIYKPYRYTADIFDIICYCFGGIFYWNVMNKKIS